MSTPMPPIMIGTNSCLPNFRRKSSTRFIVSLAPNEGAFYPKVSVTLRFMPAADVADFLKICLYDFGVACVFLFCTQILVEDHADVANQHAPLGGHADPL